MAKQVRIRRGTADQHTTFVGALGEVTMDTTNKTLCVHDGVTPGGVALAKQGEGMPANADYVVERGRTGNTWYRKYKSGLVDMGGHYVGTTQIITLPIVLDNANYEVMITKNSSPAMWATTHFAVSSITTTSFSVVQFGDNASLQIGWLIVNAMAA